MNGRRWTDNELLLLAEHFPKGDLSILSSRIGRSLSSIHAKALRIGIKRVTKGNNCPDKKCIKCKKIKPRTAEYFYTKIVKTKIKNGSIKKYKCYRSMCKECHSKETVNRKRRKRSKELGIEFDQYIHLCKWYKKHGIKRVRMRQLYESSPGLLDSRITKKERRTIRRWIRKGYKFTDYDAFKLDQLEVKKERSVKKRKYHDLPSNYDFYSQVPKKELNKIKFERRKNNPTKGTVANWLGLKSNEISDEVYKTKVLLWHITNFIKTEDS